MARTFVAGSILAVLVLAAAVDQSAAQVRNTYFSNGEVSGLQRYQDERQLPGPTTEFVKARDPVSSTGTRAARTASRCAEG